MKKISVLLSAALVMFALNGCQNDVNEGINIENNAEGTTFVLSANIDSTRTTTDATTYEVEWEDGDVIYLATTDEEWGPAYSSGENSATAYPKAFTYSAAEGIFTTDATISNGEHTFNAIYVNEGQRSYHRGKSTTHQLYSSQNMDANTPTAGLKQYDALVGQFTLTTPTDVAGTVSMKHIHTLMQVNIKNNTGSDLNITSFSMTAANENLAGIFAVDFETSTATYSKNGTNSISVGITNGNVASGASLPVYFVMAPLAGYNGDITFEVADSNGNTYTKTITASGLTFAAGTYNTTSYTISTADEKDSNTENIVSKDLGVANSKEVGTKTVGDTTIAFAKGTNSNNAPKYYNSGEATRMYAGNTLTISSSKTIIKVVFTFTNESYSNLEANGGTYTATGATGTWTGSSKSIVFTSVNDPNTTDNEQSRIVKIEVTYGESSGETPEPEDIVAPTITINNISDVPAAGVNNAQETVGLGSPVGNWTYTVTSEATWLSNMSLSEGKVIYTVAANTGDARDATVTITASCDGQTDVTKTFTITQAAGNQSGEETTTWTRVTDVNTLLAGGTFIIGYEASANSGVIVPLRSGEAGAKTTANGYFYSGTTSGSSTSSTINMTSVSDTSAYEVTISASTTVSGAINIQMSTGNYFGNNNAKNTGRLYASPSANTAYVPTFGANDVVTLKCNAATSYHTLQYNTGSPRFANYNGGQKNVVIYKKN